MKFLCDNDGADHLPSCCDGEVCVTLSHFFLLLSMLMFYGDHVQDTRQVFFASWSKYRKNQPLSPLEQQVVEVILLHPEYQDVLESASFNIESAYFPALGATNPFLHMGLHLAIREQVATDRPEGIQTIYQKLLIKYTDKHTVEHLLIDPLAECLWQAQRAQTEPDELSYLNACSAYL